MGGVKVALRDLDCLVVKAMAAWNNEGILLVVDVKPSNFPQEQAIDQLLNYLDAFLQKQQNDTDEPLVESGIGGLVVMGGRVIVVTLGWDGSFGVASPRPFDHWTIHTVLLSTWIEAI
jgi:hypothetical protein